MLVLVDEGVCAPLPVARPDGDGRVVAVAVKEIAPVAVPLKVSTAVDVGAEAVGGEEREPNEDGEVVGVVEREGEGLEVIPAEVETREVFEVEGEGESVRVARDVNDTSGEALTEEEGLGDRDALGLGDKVACAEGDEMLRVALGEEDREGEGEWVWEANSVRVATPLALEVVETAGDCVVLEEAVDEHVPFPPPAVAVPKGEKDVTLEKLLLAVELLLCSALLVPEEEGVGVIKAVLVPCPLNPDTETPGVKVPPARVPDPIGGVADTQGEAVVVDDPDTVPPLSALSVAAPVKVGVREGKVGKEVDEGLAVLLSFQLAVGVTLSMGAAEDRALLLPVCELRGEEVWERDTVGDSERLVEGVDERVGKGEEEGEGDPVTRLEGLAEGVIEAEELGDLDPRSLPLPRLVCVAMGEEEEVRVVAGVRLVLVDVLPLFVITGERVGMATDAVGIAPVAVLNGGLLEGYKGVVDACPLLDTATVPEGAGDTLPSAVCVDDMDKDGVGVLTMVLLVVGVVAADTFEDNDAAPLIDVEGDMEEVSEVSPVDVPPPPPRALLGVPLPTPVPLATPTVILGVVDRLPAPEAVFWEDVEDTVEVEEIEVVAVGDPVAVKAATLGVLVPEGDLEVEGQAVLLENTLPVAATLVGEVEVEGVAVDSPAKDALPCADTEGLVPVTMGEGEAVVSSTVTEGKEEGEDPLDAVALWLGDSVPAATVMDGEVEEDSVKVVSGEGVDWALCEPLLLGL